MASTWFSFLFLVHLVTLVFGIQQKITLYTEPDQGGESVTFLWSKSDLSDYSIITNNTKSYCAIGRWHVFTLKDFEDIESGLGSFSEATTCGNYTGEILSSIRHLGAPDTLTQALSLYEWVNASGREHFVTSLASNNFPFFPRQYVSSGKTVWTLFEGSNFDGNSKCTPPGGYNSFYGNISPLQTVGSVVKGCGTEAQRNIANYKHGLNELL